MKFGTVILCNVTKKLVEKKIQNCNYSDDDVTNYVNFLKNYAKNGQNMFFSKIKVVAARKTIFKQSFQLLKVKITCKLNVYRLIC